MMTLLLDPQLVAFALVAAVVTVIPGVDMALIARSVLSRGRRARALLRAGVHVVIGLVWLIFYAYSLGRLSAILRLPRVRRTLEGVTGTLLVVARFWSRAGIEYSAGGG